MAHNLSGAKSDLRMIPRSRIQVTDRSVHVGSPSAKSGHDPQVELVRDGNGVQAIRITCRCGEVLQLDVDCGPPEAGA